MDYLVHHMLRGSAARFPDKEALVHGPQRLSYAEAWRRTSHLAAGLRRAGVTRNDRVGTLLDPSVPLALSIFGISQAGGVFVPMHHGLYPEQVAHIVTDCAMKGLVIDAGKLDKLQEVLSKCPSLEFVVVVDGEDCIHVELPCHGFEQLCSELSPPNLDEVALEKDLAAILYTSGSTGKPKGVMLSHANVMAGASIVSEYLAINSTDRILAVLPFSFDAGLNQLTTAIEQGGTCVILKFLFAREIVKAAKEERITGLAGVPSLWNLLAQPSSNLSKTELPDLRYITNTGGAMPQNVLAALRESLPGSQMFLMYGLTEAFRSTYLPPEQIDGRPTSIGKAIPNTEIMVVDPQGRRCSSGEVGELVHHGPTVSLGYWGHPQLTDQVLRPHPFPPPGCHEGVKVCYSGDLVRIDEEGFLYFVGRRDNLIKSSGFRISPTEVEEGLCQSGPLREAAVIGIPDQALGQRIKAFVVANEGASVEPDQLLSRCATIMPRHMVPKAVEVLDALPKTGSGKVNYPALRERESV